MRIVLDTNILVRAHAAAAGPGRELLRQIDQGRHTLILSPFLLAEVRRVLAYPRLQARWPLSREEIGEYVASLAEIAELVDLEAGGPSGVMTRDPDDNPVVQTAVEGKAEVLCTLDRHFRDPLVVAYCAESGIRIVGDVELLRELRAEDTTDPDE